MTRYFIHLAYKGSNYHGWQMQSNALTIQAVLEDKLNTILNQKFNIVGCGRTDTGVHSTNYYAHFEFEGSLKENVVYKLNAMLPPDIMVYKIYPVASDLHARFSATERTYKYKITLEKDPFQIDEAWLCPYPLDLDLMNAAVEYLLGNKNFRAFCKGAEKEEDNSFMCNVFDAKWEKQGRKLVFTISANRFLRNMVRAIVGTMIEVGRKRISPADISDIIKSQDRQNSGMSVPANGLYLNEIKYPKS